jgi:hypothetical protein
MLVNGILKNGIRLPLRGGRPVRLHGRTAPESDPGIYL